MKCHNLRNDYARFARIHNLSATVLRVYSIYMYVGTLWCSVQV